MTYNRSYIKVCCGLLLYVSIATISGIVAVMMNVYRAYRKFFNKGVKSQKFSRDIEKNYSSLHHPFLAFVFFLQFHCPHALLIRVFSRGNLVVLLECREYRLENLLS